MRVQKKQMSCLFLRELVESFNYEFQSVSIIVLDESKVCVIPRQFVSKERELDYLEELLLVQAFLLHHLAYYSANCKETALLFLLSLLNALMHGVLILKFHLLPFKDEYLLSDHVMQKHVDQF